MPMTIAEQRAEHIPPIQINAENTSIVTITQKEVGDAHKTLGCYKELDGNESAQIKYVTTKSC
jgi:hypothetical protein